MKIIKMEKKRYRRPGVRRGLSKYDTRQLIQLMVDFYSDPKNRAAYNAWKAGRA